MTRAEVGQEEGRAVELMFLQSAWLQATRAVCRALERLFEDYRSDSGDNELTDKYLAHLLSTRVAQLTGFQICFE